MYSLYPEDFLGSCMSWYGIYAKFWQVGLTANMLFKQLIRGSEAAACNSITCNLLKEKVKIKIPLPNNAMKTTS